ncbi:MAG: hypothetical protein LBV00_00195 [Propionibacteriaceae bacterium]|jgi:hypothetical protein|nr:hypothetical protein [Propionibacteriaceae bacterium]
MRLRLAETPWGAARFTFAYLAGLIAAVVAAVVAGIAYPILSSSALLGGADRVYALLLAVMASVVVGWAIGLGLTGFIFRLGWSWAVTAIVWTLLVVELAVWTVNFGLFWLVILGPAVAAAVSFARPDRPTASRVAIARAIILACLGAEFLVWLTVGLITA